MEFQAHHPFSLNLSNDFSSQVLFFDPKNDLISIFMRFEQNKPESILIGFSNLSLVAYLTFEIVCTILIISEERASH